MASWRCSCPICRLLVHPVLRRAGGSSAVTGLAESQRAAQSPRPSAETGGELQTEVGAAAEAPAIQSAPLSPPQQPVITEEVIEGLAVKVTEGLREVLEGSNKVLVERLERIEENVGKLRKEIQGLVSSMENMIVEFREAISELSNPFAAAARPRIEIPMASGGTTLPPLASDGETRLTALVRSLRQLVEQIGLETLEELIDEYVKAGVLKEEEARKIKAIARTLAKLRGKDIDESTLLPLLAKASG